jgi:hypothetical protein
MALYYSQFNVTEMREALDAHELASKWVLAHREDEEAVRKEEEEEAAEIEAEKVAYIG